MPIITQFGGIIPRQSRHLLQMQNATIAHDVKIRNGRLEAWRERKAIATATADALSLHYHGCCAYTYDTCVDMAEFVADYGRLFFTGRVEYPETARIGNNCALTYYRLGVPQPATALTARGTEEFSRQADERSYVYTYVNVFGEEGAPSRASNSLTVKDGTAVTLTGFTEPDLVYGVTAINLYRTGTIQRTGAEQTQEPGTEFLLVATLSLSITSYIDKILLKALGPALTTEDAREPPADLRQISYLRGTGVLAGVTNNQVHFSHPYQPSNWKAEYDLTLPYNIVHAGALGSYLFVTTDAYPYVIQGAPNCEPRKCRGVTEVMAPLPDIGCGYQNGAVVTPFGLVYSSKDGLVLVMADAKYQVITSAWFSTDDWAQVRPETVRLAYWRGYLICVTDMVSFMLEIDGGTYNDSKNSALFTISDKPVALTTTQSGELLLLEDDIIYQWHAGNSLRPYIWRSRELGLGGEYTPTVAKVRTNGITLRLLDSDLRHLYERFVADENPVRLARLGRQRHWYLEFRGTGSVDYAALDVIFNVLQGDVNGAQI